MRQAFSGLEVKIEKMERASDKDEWTRHMQMRTPADLWRQKNCVTPFQMWVAYRDATLQLNLFYDGRQFSTACPVDAGCGNTYESIPHIVWSCNRARTIWNGVFERWTGKKAEAVD